MTGISGVQGQVNSSVYPSYVYKNNQVSANSLGKVNAIPNDATKGGTDYSGSYSNSLNQNQLGPGQTRNYPGVVGSQQSQSDRNVNRMVNTGQMTGAQGTNPVNAQAQQATAPKDPAQNPNLSISEITKQKNQMSSPSADLMKTPTPAEKQQQKVEESKKPTVQKKPQDQIKEMVDKKTQPQSQADQQQKSISEQSASMNQQAAPNANIMNQNGSNGSGGSNGNGQNQSAIPNVSMG